MKHGYVSAASPRPRLRLQRIALRPLRRSQPTLIRCQVLRRPLVPPRVLSPTAPADPQRRGRARNDAQRVQRALANSVSEAEPASANPAEQSLDVLVRDHAAAGATDEESECLAGAVYFEARGEPLEGQLAVAEVVLNRAASGEYPASICEVVKQPAQFSFVRNGALPPIDENSVAWRTAVAVAHIADEKLATELASDVLWYHAEYVAPAWGRRLARVTQIGAHIFYRRG